MSADDRLDVRADHRGLLGGVELREAPAAAEAGVVDEHLDGQPALLDLVDQLLAAALVRDVAGDDLGLDAVDARRSRRPARAGGPRGAPPASPPARARPARGRSPRRCPRGSRR